MDERLGWSTDRDQFPSCDADNAGDPVSYDHLELGVRLVILADDIEMAPVTSVSGLVEQGHQINDGQEITVRKSAPTGPRSCGNADRHATEA